MHEDVAVNCRKFRENFSPAGAAPLVGDAHGPHFRRAREWAVERGVCRLRV